MWPVEPLNAEVIRHSLGAQRIGHRLLFLAETTSTNDVIAQMANTENAEGLVVFAERQTAGRGQYGRAWESAAGRGLWLSILLRPKISVSESRRLTDWLATTIAGTIAQEFALPAQIKPPNDVYVGSRKVAGVLVEMRVDGGGQYFAIAGIGLNVNQAREDFPAALRDSAGSIAMAINRAADRQQLAITLLRKLEASYASICA